VSSTLCSRAASFSASISIPAIAHTKLLVVQHHLSSAQTCGIHGQYHHGAHLLLTLILLPISRLRRLFLQPATYRRAPDTTTNTPIPLSTRVSSDIQHVLPTSRETRPGNTRLDLRLHLDFRLFTQAHSQIATFRRETSQWRPGYRNCVERRVESLGRLHPTRQYFHLSYKQAHLHRGDLCIL
jgi:hypothetical protein